MRKHIRILPTLSVLLLFFTLIYTVNGQEQLEIIINQDEISLQTETEDDSDLGELLIPFELVNIGGVPADNLAERELTLLLNGEPIPFSLTQTADESQPIELMVIIEASNETIVGGEFELIKQAVIDLRQSLSLDDALGVYMLRDAVSPTGSEDSKEFAPSRDGGGAINFILSFDTEGTSGDLPLFDGLFRVAAGFESRQITDRRRAVVLVAQNGEPIESNGLPDVSQNADLDLAIFEAQRLDIPLFAVGLENGNRYQPIQFHKASRMTGGAYLSDRTAEDLSQTLLGLRDRLRLRTELIVELSPEMVAQVGEPLLIELTFDRPGAFAQEEILYSPEELIGNSFLGDIGGGFFQGGSFLLLLVSSLLGGLVSSVGFYFWQRGRQVVSALPLDQIPKGRWSNESDDSNDAADPPDATPDYNPDRTEPRSEKTIVDDSFKPILLDDEAEDPLSDPSLSGGQTELLTEDSEPAKEAASKQLHETVILEDLDIPEIEVSDLETETSDDDDLPKTQILDDVLSKSDDEGKPSES